MYSRQARRRRRPVGSPARRLVLPPLHHRVQCPGHKVFEPRTIGTDRHGRVPAPVAVHGRVGAGAALHQWRVLYLCRDGEEWGQCVAPDVCVEGDEHDGPDEAFQRECGGVGI